MSILRLRYLLTANVKSESPKGARTAMSVLSALRGPCSQATTLVTKERRGGVSAIW